MSICQNIFIWKRCVLAIGVSLAIAGCQPSVEETAVDPATPTTTDTTSDNSTPTPTVVPEKAIATQPISPDPIRIRVANLPEPFHSQSASKPPQIANIPDNPTLNLPPGFQVNVFADNLNQPRWLALTPTGDVLVTETPENRIRLLQDENGDGVADNSRIFAGEDNGLYIPFGMAFAQGSFWVGNTNAVLRFPYSAGQKQLQGVGKKIADLPGEGYRQHWTRNVVVSPDNQQLYVSVGSRSNVSPEEPPRASVLQMNLDGSSRQVFASGLRNPVGMDFHPTTEELYVTVNERDGLGDDLVPDYLTRIRQGEFYGWPYAYFKPSLLDPRRTNNGTSERPDLVKQTKMPDVLFASHSAALGLVFYRGEQFPQKYHEGAFVAFRGSWNRDRAAGYKLVFVPFNENGRPQGYYENFLTGFVLDPAVPRTWGRPVGLLELPDGSLLFTEEANNRIYRISYDGSE